MERAAWGLKQSGPRIFGFQNAELSIAPLVCSGDIHARSTTHTKPFLPSTAVSYPCRPRTRILASRDIDSGAALRANATSASRSIRYCSSGAIVECDDLLSCACIGNGPTKAAANAMLRQLILVIRFWLIASSRTQHVLYFSAARWFYR